MKSRPILQLLFLLAPALFGPLLGAGNDQNGGASRAGLLRVHFHDPDFRRPTAPEVAPQIQLDTGTQHSAFSSVWLGRIRVPTEREIVLSAEADDGVTLTIGGREIIDGWHTPVREARWVATAGAELPMEVRFFQNGGAAFLRLFWAWEGHARELIPPQAFSHTPADRRRAEALATGLEKLALPALRLERSKPVHATQREWSPGPWLLLDEQIILSVEQLARKIGQPLRHGEPVVDGAVDHNFQPYLSVVRDAGSGRFRLWYNVPRTPGNAMESSLAFMESDDGIHWRRPHRILATPSIQFGASVMDEGPAFPDQARRFKAGWYKDGGLQVAASPDGLAWSALAPGPVLRHSHDINAIDWDPVRRRYMAFVSFGAKLDPAWTSERRIPYMSVSDDLIQWRQPWPIILPDPSSPREQGETQFYCMAGAIARGELLIGLVKILRDDLNSEPGQTASEAGNSRPFAGLGYTVLAWSQDGEHWNRDTEPFLDRNPQPGSWDRAHAWGDDQLVVGNEVFIYYGGYKLGHKADRFRTRQIGLARMKLDRYAGYEALGPHAGMLRTTIREFKGTALTVNADIRGELRLAICEPSGKFVPGFTFEDCQPIRGNDVAHAVRWNQAQPSSLAGKRVQLVFRVQDGSLFAFGINP